MSNMINLELNSLHATKINNLNSTMTTPLNFQAEKIQNRSTLISFDQRNQVSGNLIDVIKEIFNSLVECIKSCFNCFGLFSKSLQLTDRNIHPILNDDEIRRRLNRQMDFSQQQMIQEPSKDFHYSNAPAGSHVIEERVGDLLVGISHAQGRRRTMEDEHLAVAFPIQIKDKIYPIQLFGIFDGHGGPKASQYVRDHLQNKLSQALIEFNPNGLTDVGIWRALKMTFVRLDEGFRNPSISYRQGTTATVAIVLDNKLWTANVGDSRTVLDNQGIPFQLTEDAKPSDARYKRNIRKRGGCVIPIDGVMRVNGNLAVARSIGDHLLNGAINPRPKITVKPLSEIQPGSHLILCCDGIYDVARTTDIVAAAHAHQSDSAGTIAKNIVFSAYQSDSMDNLSCMVVKI